MFLYKRVPLVAFRALAHPAGGFITAGLTDIFDLNFRHDGKSYYLRGNLASIVLVRLHEVAGCYRMLHEVT